MWVGMLGADFTSSGAAVAIADRRPALPSRSGALTSAAGAEWADGTGGFGTILYGRPGGDHRARNRSKRGRAGVRTRENRRSKGDTSGGKARGADAGDLQEAGSVGIRHRHRARGGERGLLLRRRLPGGRLLPGGRR